MPTYYVDATAGNDAWDGLAPAWVAGLNGPWKTITKVNGFAFVAGDSCLFKCGETWAIQLKPTVSGALGNHIKFGTYNKGNGQKAKLTLGISINVKSYLTFNGLRISGGMIDSTGGGSYLYFDYCIIENTGTYAFYGTGAQTNIRFYNCIFNRNSDYDIKTGAAIIVARNCIFLSNATVLTTDNNSSNPFKIGVSGVLDLDYCFINTVQWPLMTRVTDGGHNIWYSMPKIAAYSTSVVPHLVLSFDDSTNIDAFESMVSGVFATYGIKATFFCCPGNNGGGIVVPPGQMAKLAAFITAGHEVGNHGWSHANLTATQGFVVTSANTAPTIDVDVAATTITLWCTQVANRVIFNWSGDKTITDLKAAVAGKDWTITNSVEGGKTIPNQLKLDCLSDSAGAQPCPYTTLLDIVAPNYKFWDHEVNDAQNAIEAACGVRPISFAYPYGTILDYNANLIAWLKIHTTLISARTAVAISPSLFNVPIWEAKFALLQWSAASTEATVREWAWRQYGWMIGTPAYHISITHGTDASWWTRFGWWIDELQNLGVIFCTYKQLIDWIKLDHVLVGDDLIKNYIVDGADYHLWAESPCINAGMNVGLIEDSEGTSIPPGKIPNVGIFEQSLSIKGFDGICGIKDILTGEIK